MEKEFLQEVANFKNWAKTADQSFGEWETEYLHWDRIYQSAEIQIKAVPVGEWNGELLEEFLFILARDNECENIMDILIQYPDQLIALARHAVVFKDPHARWQIASRLGKLNAEPDEREILLKSFMVDKDEYVRKRAALAWEEKEY